MNADGGRTVSEKLRAFVRCRSVAVLLTVLVAAVAAAGISYSARASHGPSNPSWVHVRAPFTGYWDRFGLADPSSHSPGYWGGDWATDFYQASGTEGRWYASSSVGSSIAATVADRRNTCNKSSWEDAGVSYKISLTDSSGYLGWFSWNHVHPQTAAGYGYWLGFGASLSNGMLIGTTHQYDYQAGCWEVSTPGGVHWHIVAYNEHNYACYYPHSSGTLLSQQTDILGAVGANATGPGQACW